MPGSNPRGRAGGGPGRGLGFDSPPLAWATPPRISGITKDSTGTVLGGCTVKLSQTASDLVLNTMVSDATTGAYSFDLSPSYGFCYIVAYKSGSPDVAGTTVSTLTGV